MPSILLHARERILWRPCPCYSTDRDTAEAEKLGWVTPVTRTRMGLFLRFGYVEMEKPDQADFARLDGAWLSQFPITTKGAQKYGCRRSIPGVAVSTSLMVGLLCP
jgi:hypothetical protein